MPTEVPRPKNVGRPPRLSLEAIITAADRILHSEGAEKLSMRHLANELGSTPMALYYHVRDKDELLLLVMEMHAQRIPRPQLPDDPRERLVTTAVMLYDLLAERLWIIDVLTGDDLIAPSSLWFVEVMIDAAVEYGHSPEQAVYVYRTIWYYIVGDLIIRVNSKRRRARASHPVYEDEVIAGLTSGTHPQLAAVADRWAELNARDTHREGLAAIVDGLLPQRSEAHD
ncbi:regulatory protein, tetR family [Saccharopolyspora antimicrobica]|uniref:Regulatory protein, tetR family n=1 Tax=Saccharopolyspora antimicrobica TaxID=455193 RepID=A0A1I5C5Z1_9PSEU|nr:TetR/AcrR family transcriptional regulator C-terminal domain-containing protein [Saccharopolyspora antimicrobica]RKT88959.1 TetR family transcriptional regulator [Saccharopolyspora antimicrobica]SFN82439.1 regulatory protein, tetR family [Saccharopolyspora antimicrobica]